MSKEITPQSSNNEEVDISQLFKLIGRTFDRFFGFIGSIFNKLFLAFVWVVFFVKKKIYIIALAAIIGAAYGFIIQKTERPVYYSDTIIKQNYNTGENLYLLIDFYNGLISDKDSISLAKNLNISETQANLIKGLDVGTTLSENQELRLFDNYKKELDSTIASTLEFETFMENFKDSDFEFQKITLKSYSKEVFNNVLSQIIKNVESSEFIRNEQKKDLAEFENRERAIKESLMASDSLQKVYQNVLVKSVESSTGSQTSVTIDNTEDVSVTKEYELYNSDLDLKRELVSIQRQKEDIQNIIDVVSTQQNEGTLFTSVDVFGFSLSKIIFYGLFLALFVFTVLLGLEFLKFLENYKSKL